MERRREGGKGREEGGRGVGRNKGKRREGEGGEKGGYHPVNLIP